MCVACNEHTATPCGDCGILKDDDVIYQTTTYRKAFMLIPIPISKPVATGNLILEIRHALAVIKNAIARCVFTNYQWEELALAELHLDSETLRRDGLNWRCEDAWALYRQSVSHLGHATIANLRHQ